MYKILSLLESRSSGQTLDNSAIWFWAVCLAASKVAHVGLTNWLQWVSFGLFSIPVRSQLSAVIFAKSLRMKTVQGGDTDIHNVSSDNGDEEVVPHETDALLPQEIADEPEPKDVDQSASKGIVNLLGVDVQRVAEFCGYNMDLFRSTVKVTLAAFLLATLIGWWRYDFNLVSRFVDADHAPAHLPGLLYRSFYNH